MLRYSLDRRVTRNIEPLSLPCPGNHRRRISRSTGGFLWPRKSPYCLAATSKGYLAVTLPSSPVSTCTSPTLISSGACTVTPPASTCSGISTGESASIVTPEPQPANASVVSTISATAAFLTCSPLSRNATFDWSIPSPAGTNVARPASSVHRPLPNCLEDTFS